MGLTSFQTMYITIKNSTCSQTTTNIHLSLCVRYKYIERENYMTGWPEHSPGLVKGCLSTTARLVTNKGTQTVHLFHCLTENGQVLHETDI